MLVNAQTDLNEQWALHLLQFLLILVNLNKILSIVLYQLYQSQWYYAAPESTPQLGN